MRRDDSFLQFPSITVPPPLGFDHSSEISLLAQSSLGGGTELEDPEPTEPPVKGAIDYVLLPLLFLGVAGPLFVVIYVVVAVIESRLTPNNQLKSLHTNYIDMSSVFQSARPAINILYESVSRAIDSEQCKEQVACQMGSYVQPLEKYMSLDYFERVMRMLVPRRYFRSLKVLVDSSKNGSEQVCSKYNCIFMQSS
jgi:hypothetical protein